MAAPRRPVPPNFGQALASTHENVDFFVTNEHPLLADSDF